MFRKVFVFTKMHQVQDIHNESVNSKIPSSSLLLPTTPRY